MRPFDGTLRRSLRTLLRRPWFAFSAAGTFAIGIACVTVVFAIARGVLLRPLPFPEPDRLLQVFETFHDATSGESDPRGYFAWQNFADIRAQTRSFSALAAWQYYDRTLTGAGPARRLSGRMVTPDFLAVLGIDPLLGRGFTREDATPGNERRVLLGNGVWRDAFGSDPKIVGRTVLLDGIAHEVVGVMPAAFDFPYEADIWMPLVPELGENGIGARRFHRYRVAGRLRPDATPASAEAELAAIGDRLRSAYPETNAHDTFPAEPLLAVVAGDARAPLRALLAGVGVLLLLACANVSGLVVAAHVRRNRALAVRSALGASRGRIAGELLAETGLLAVLGGTAGATLAVWSLPVVVRLLGDSLPRASAVRIDGAVLAFAFATSALAMLVAGLVPALRMSRADGSLLLRGGRGVADGGTARIRRGLVIAELALAFTLVAGAALLGRTFVALLETDSPVDVAGLLTMDVSLPEAAYPTPARAAPVYAALRERIANIPGVTSVAAGMVAPLDGRGWGNRLEVEGRPRSEAETPIIQYVIITPAWFATAGADMLDGREFDDGLDARGDAVILNRAAARTFFPDRDALGRLVRFSDDSPWATVVGIAPDLPPEPGAPGEPTVYVPTTLEGLRSMTLLIRVDRGMGPVVEEARRIISEAEPDAPVTAVQTLEQRIAETLTGPRALAGLAGGFAVVALLLSGIGTYGVLAHLVSERSAEIGIRVALGAPARLVAVSILREAATLAGIALAIALPLALVFGQALRGLLFGVSATDPATLAGVAAFIVTIALLAAALPALRAARLDPMAAMRQEG